MFNYVIGLLLAFSIGAACRWFDIPVPAPPRIMGALLVVAMTMGYISADRFKGSSPTSSVPSKVEVSANARPPDVRK